MKTVKRLGVTYTQMQLNGKLLHRLIKRENWISSEVHVQFESEANRIFRVSKVTPFFGLLFYLNSLFKHFHPEHIPFCTITWVGNIRICLNTRQICGHSTPTRFRWPGEKRVTCIPSGPRCHIYDFSVPSHVTLGKLLMRPMSHPGWR